MSTSRETDNKSATFEQKRGLLISEIALSLEHVLMNMNLLNMSLEGAIDIGKELESVEALWAKFENLMDRDPEKPTEAGE
ncbi:Dolichyl-diphosphooligosaccharide-protein glycosyltransferase subunit dad1 [Rhizina undulata]